MRKKNDVSDNITTNPSATENQVITTNPAVTNPAATNPPVTTIPMITNTGATQMTIPATTIYSTSNNQTTPTSSTITLISPTITDLLGPNNGKTFLLYSIENGQKQYYYFNDSQWIISLDKTNSKDNISSNIAYQWYADTNNMQTGYYKIMNKINNGADTGYFSNVKTVQITNINGFHLYRQTDTNNPPMTNKMYLGYYISLNKIVSLGVSDINSIPNYPKYLNEASSTDTHILPIFYIEVIS